MTIYRLNFLIQWNFKSDIKRECIIISIQNKVMQEEIQANAIQPTATIETYSNFLRRAPLAQFFQLNLDQVKILRTVITEAYQKSVDQNNDRSKNAAAQMLNTLKEQLQAAQQKRQERQKLERANCLKLGLGYIAALAAFFFILKSSGSQTNDNKTSDGKTSDSKTCQAGPELSDIIVGCFGFVIITSIAIMVYVKYIREG